MLQAYLTFNGNCREAMLFYQRCLGGRLTLQTVGDADLGARLHARMRACILHATLEGEGFVIMGSDMSPDEGRMVGNNVSIALVCSSRSLLEGYYTGLCEGAIQANAFTRSREEDLYALTDRYGNRWLLMTEGKRPD